MPAPRTDSHDAKRDPRTHALVTAGLVALAAPSVAAQVALLPDQVAMQVSGSGVSWYAPKPLAIALPAAVALGGALYHQLRGAQAGVRDTGMIASLLGSACGIISIVINALLA